MSDSQHQPLGAESQSHATGHIEDCPGDVGGPLARQESHGGSELLWFTKTAQRNVFGSGAVEEFLGAELWAPLLVDVVPLGGYGYIQC